MRNKLICSLILVLVFLSFSCEPRRSSAANPSPDKEEIKAPVMALDVDTPLLEAPTILEQREGKTPESTQGASKNSQSTRPGNSWIYNANSKGGAFLLAATSKASAIGGDMIRRLDLSGSQITEHDYNTQVAGKQGAYILIPDGMRSSVPSKLIDADGLFSGSICAFVAGPDKTIIAISGSIGGSGGVAFVLNPYEDAQALTPLQAIALPYVARPCRAVYSDQWRKLFVIDVAHVSSQSGQEGVLVADVVLNNQATTAVFYNFDKKYKINDHSLNNFFAIELYNDQLYLVSGNARYDAQWDTTIYKVPLNELGEPLFSEAKATRTFNPIERVMGCNMSSNNIGAAVVVETADKPVLLTSGTNATVAWDISGQEPVKMDLDPKKPGSQAKDVTDNGRGGPKFAFDPTGKTLFELHHCRSESHKIKIKGYSDYVAFNLSEFDAKTLAYAPDPPDAGYLGLLKSLAASKASYLPQMPMTFIDFAVGTRYIAIIGGSGGHISGLGAAGDVIIIDRKEKTPIAFSKPADMRRAHEEKYGFKLAQGDSDFAQTEQRSHAVIWVP